MEPDAIIDTLRRHKAELQRYGVAHAALFGSRVRFQDRPDSDIDILIDLDPEVRLSVYDYVGVKQYIAALFEARVDVVSRAGLKPHLRSSVIATAIDAF